MLRTSLRSAPCRNYRQPVFSMSSIIASVTGFACIWDRAIPWCQHKLCSESLRIYAGRELWAGPLTKHVASRTRQQGGAAIRFTSIVYSPWQHMVTRQVQLLSSGVHTSKGMGSVSGIYRSYHKPTPPSRVPIASENLASDSGIRANHAISGVKDPRGVARTSPAGRTCLRIAS